MQYTKIPALYFPTTAIFIDDSKRFLTNTSYKLHESLAYLLFDNPKRALDYIIKDNNANHLLDKYLAPSIDINTASVNHHLLNLDIRRIHETIYESKRFDMVSVVVVDYSMPVINGVEFCKRLQSSHIKIIMVTGEADQQLAVELFNDGLIDKFIKKSDPNFDFLLNNSIQEMQLKYFQELTDKVISMISAEPFYCLNKPDFIKLFEDIINANNIAEYYLLDTPGNFLLLDSHGKSKWLIVNSIEDINMFKELAQDTHAPSAVLDELTALRKLGYFYDANTSYKIQGEQWENYLYPAKVLNQTYVYSLVDNLTDAKLNSNKILCYEDYLDNEWPPV